jgi:hypothetical protein
MPRYRPGQYHMTSPPASAPVFGEHLGPPLPSMGHQIFELSFTLPLIILNCSGDFPLVLFHVSLMLKELRDPLFGRNRARGFRRCGLRPRKSSPKP